MGKTTVAGVLTGHGLRVVDTDVLARELVKPGQPAWDEIKSTFGPGIVSPDGQLRREELACRVFADPPARLRLESILHPRIRLAWQTQIEEWRAAGQTLAVVVIPLLFETQAEASFNKILCVACLPASQQERLAARGWTTEQISQRVAAQLPIEQKVNQANYVIWTEGRLDSTVRQVERILMKAE